MLAIKRTILIISIFWFFAFYIPIAAGDMLVTLNDKKNFNLGDFLISSTSIKLDENLSGFIRIGLHCLNYGLPFYTAPLEVEAGFRTVIEIPQISLPRSSEGKCRLRADFDDVEGTRIDSGWSDYFLVESELDVSAEDNLVGKPGEKVTINAHARRKDSQLVNDAKVTVTFLGQEEKINLLSGNLNYELPIKNDLKPGSYNLYLTIIDDKGNTGYKEISVRLEAVPTSIGIHLDKENINPGENIKLKFTLNDQAGTPIKNKSIVVEILEPTGNVFINENVESGDYLESSTKMTQEPGTYKILAMYPEINEQSTFIIQEVKEILMNQDGYYVHISNNGNIQYEDDITIVLEDGDKSFLINRFIRLEPGEKISIDLSREVPQGNYDILLPTVNEQSIEENVSNNLKSVPIEDNRNMVKKASHGFSLVTGAVTRTTGYVTSRPLLAGFILVLIIAGIVLHYSWGYIKTRITGKKEDSTENIFSDFKFEDGEDSTKDENNRR
jgi:hypothetical protein